MKKFGKGLMLLALAASMVFGFVACGGDDDEEEKKDTFTSQTKTVDVKDVNATVTSVNATVTFNPTGIVTATVDGTRITLTSEKAGTTTMTIKVSGTDYTDEEVEITVTVAANGGITWKEKSEDGGEIDLTYSFKDITLDLVDTDNSADPNDPAKDGKDNLASDVTLDTDDEAVKVVLLAANNEAFGNDEIAANTASNGVTLTAKYKLKNIPTYKINNSSTGLTIKNTCIKITGVTGNVDVVVDWCIAGEKAANDRGVFVKIGDTIKGQGNAVSTKVNTNDDPKDVKNKLEASGASTGDIFIAASNESIIESITIKSK